MSPTAEDTANPLRDARGIASPSARLRFGQFELRPSERVLLADGAPVTLGSRAFDLLVAFAVRPGTLITKDDLLAAVWQDLVVEENNLRVQVSALRKILGRRALATIPGRGYTLPVARDDGDVAGRSRPIARLPTQCSRTHRDRMPVRCQPGAHGREREHRGAAAPRAPRPLLDARLPSGTRAWLAAEGAALREEEVCKLALGDTA